LPGQRTVEPTDPMRDKQGNVTGDAMRTPIAYLPTLVLLASVMASPLGAQEATREVSASITYRQRIALPQDARVAYELRNDDGDVMLEDAFPTNGGQVP